jgi:N-acetylneuraminic acid mutarotase
MTDRTRNCLTRRDVAAGLAAGAALTALPFRSAGAETMTGWSKAADVPIATQEVYPCAHKGRLWLAGGIASGMVTPFISDRVDIYDPQTDSWSSGPKLPEARHHVTLMSLNGLLYAIGGHYGSIPGGVWQMRKTVWRLNEETQKWENSLFLPEPQAEMVTAVLQGRIHIAGGRKMKGEKDGNRSDHKDVGDHFAFDPDQNEWQVRPPLPMPRNSAAGGVIGHYFHVAGGRDDSGNLPDHHVYDPKEDKWRTAAPMPQAQAGLGGAVLKDKLYVFGGEVFSPKPAVFKEAWVYDPQSDKWGALPPMPTPRHGLGAVELGGKIYCVAGATKPGGSGRSKANEVLVAG